MADVLAMGLNGFVIDVQLVGYFPGAKAVIFEFAFYPETGDELLAEGTANLVAVDRNFRARELPARLQKAFGNQ